MMYRFKRLTALFTLLVLLSCQGHQEESLDLRDRIKKIRLDNGMTILLLKRHGAPVFSAEIKIKVGNIEEEEGAHGLAHFFEHMAFKGTDKIGTNDYAKEMPLLEQISKIGTEIVNLKKQKGTAQRLEELVKLRKQLEAEHKKIINTNEFVQIYQVNGGSDINATTSNDFTTYYVSLPLNKMEMWAYLESERLLNPVLREFFTEVDVVAEERRMRIDSSPSGRLYEAFVNLAFDKSPYKTMVVGPAEDIQNFTPELATKFYKKYYIPSRMVVAIVGNIDVDETERIARKYFSRLSAKKDPGNSFLHETFDVKTFPRERTMTGPENARLYLGYHRPTHPHPDDIVMDVIKDILCEGRTSRLYKKLVIDKKMASHIGCDAALPAARLDSLFTFYALPLEGYTNKALKEAIITELQKLATTGPSDDELQKVKNSIDANLIYSLQSNKGLASQLAFYHSLSGDWQYIYELQDRIHAMSAEDIKNAVKTYFVPEKEVTIFFEKEPS